MTATTASRVMDEAFMLLDMFLQRCLLVAIHTIQSHATTRGISMAGAKTTAQEERPPKKRWGRHKA